MFIFTGYGVQKNVSNSGGVISTGVSSSKLLTVSLSEKDFSKTEKLSRLSSATRSHSDDAYRRDYKFMASEKENAPAKRDTETLILAKDSGKQFTTSSSAYIGGGKTHIYCPLLEKR